MALDFASLNQIITSKQDYVPHGPISIHTH